MNIKYANDKVIIEIPYKSGATGFRPSATGKTLMVATTGGFTVVPGAPDNLKLSLNLTVPNPNRPAQQ